MKTMPRYLLLLFCLSMMTMLLIVKFGLYMDREFFPDGRTEYSSRQPTEADDTNMELGSKHRMEVEELQERIRQLESVLVDTDQKARNLSSQISYQSLIIRSLQEYKNNPDQQTVPSTEFKYPSYIEKKIKNADILHGVVLNTEYELIPFTKFTLSKIFLIEPGLGRRVVEKPIGNRRKELVEVVLYGLDEINKAAGSSARKYTLEDFIEGMYRTDPTAGTHYELYYKYLDKPQKHSYTKITIFRPFGHLHNVETNLKNTTSTWVNLILPLSGRVDAFKQFMSRFVRVCISQDKRVFLTVVYFGEEGLQEVKDIMMTTAKAHKYRHMKLVTLKEKFSRGRGLQVGVLSWKSVDVLLFLCDVDIVFTADFLERCRVNTEKGKRVYFPILFSLYNPNIVYSLQDMKIPSEREQLIISRNTGFWRDFGYGMTCQYLSDFKAVNGFDEYISGWGGEDVFLYQKYVRSQYLIIRATDSGIFHLWHEKKCDPKLSTDQYRSCIRSKALSEASHAQLGLLAFQDEVNAHKDIAQKQISKDPDIVVHVPEMGDLRIPNMEETMNPEELAHGNFHR